jgi:hypothetical protein
LQRTLAYVKPTHQPRTPSRDQDRRTLNNLNSPQIHLTQAPSPIVPFFFGKHVLISQHSALLEYFKIIIIVVAVRTNKRYHHHCQITDSLESVYIYIYAVYVLKKCTIR